MSSKLEPQEEYNIVCINDWHIGSKVVDWELLGRQTNFIDQNIHNTRILLNGDLFHNITKHSKGAMREQELTPQQQYDKVYDILEPYANLIDGVTVGNHDYRTEDETDIDLMYMLCRELNIADKYLKYRGVVGYSINKNFYSIEMYHGTGSGSTVASVERNLKKLKRTDADVFYVGHWHKEYSKPYKEYVIDPFNKKATDKKKWFICGNTIVNTENYAEKFAYEENYPSQAIIKLSGIRRKRSIEVEWLR